MAVNEIDVLPKLGNSSLGTLLLVHPGHTLRHKKFFQACRRIKSTPPTILDASMWQYRLVVDRHAVDMHRTARIHVNITSWIYIFHEGN